MVTQRVLNDESRKWWTLGAVSLGLFMIMLDNTVVNVALPSIQRDLGARLSELEWIVSGYALAFAALLLTGGKLADLLGRRPVYKPAKQNATFLEIHHLPNRLCNGHSAQQAMNAAVKGEIDRRLAAWEARRASRAAKEPAGPG